jgi:choice-of-anchor A domain-containing protein
MRIKELFVLAAVLTTTPIICKADPFGIASAYNLTALGTAGTPGHPGLPGNINTNVDVGGRVAAAGSVHTGQVGQSLSEPNGDPYRSDATFGNNTFDIVAEGGLPNGATVKSSGNIYSSTTPSGNINWNGGGSKQVVTGSPAPIDFTSLRNTLTAQSLFLASSTETASLSALGEIGKVLGTNSGLPNVNPQAFVLLATNNTLDVFNITAAQFASGILDVHTNPGAHPTIIINVIGNAAISGQFEYNEQQVSGDSQTTDNVLFNFPDASSVDINGQFSASILAPEAVLSGGSQMDGTFIAAQIGSTGEVHYVPYTGDLPTDTPSVPEPGTLALVGTGILSIAGAVRRKKASLLT